MKLGIDLYSYHNTLMRKKASLEDVLQKIAEMGVRSVIIEDILLTGVDIGELKRLLRSLDIDPIFSCSVGYVRKGSSFERAVSYTIKAIRIASMLGADTLKIVGGGIPTFPKEPQIEAVTKALRRIVSEAEKESIRLALENHGDFTTSEIIRIIELVDWDMLGVAFDTVNQLWVGEDSLESLLKLYKWLVLIKLRDCKRINNMLLDVPIGEGIVKVNRIINELNKLHYEGYLYLAVYLIKGNEHEAIERSMKYVGNVLTG